MFRICVAHRDAVRPRRIRRQEVFIYRRGHPWEPEAIYRKARPLCREAVPYQEEHLQEAAVHQKEGIHQKAHRLCPGAVPCLAPLRQEEAGPQRVHRLCPDTAPYRVPLRWEAAVPQKARPLCLAVKVCPGSRKREKGIPAAAAGHREIRLPVQRQHGRQQLPAPFPLSAGPRSPKQQKTGIRKHTGSRKIRVREVNVLRSIRIRQNERLKRKNGKSRLFFWKQFCF